MNRVPGQVLTHTLFQIFHAIAVRAQEDQRVAIATTRIATIVEYLPRFYAGFTLQIVQRVCEMWLEDDQARGWLIVSDIRAGCGADMHARKITTVALL